MCFSNPSIDFENISLSVPQKLSSCQHQEDFSTKQDQFQHDGDKGHLQQHHHPQLDVTLHCLWWCVIAQLKLLSLPGVWLDY